MIRFLERLPLPLWSLLALLIVVAVTLGCISLQRRKSCLDVELMFARQFRNRFHEYAESRGQDENAYSWLTLNSIRMQTQMGHHGIMAVFRDPPYQYTNYPIILNMLPRIRSDFNSWNSFVNNPVELIRMFDEALLRYLGHMDELRKIAAADSGNPFRWFRHGIEQILSVPIYFLVAFGVLSRGAVYAAQGSLLFKLFTAIAVLLGAISAFVSIINEGKPAWAHIERFLGLL